MEFLKSVEHLSHFKKENLRGFDAHKEVVPYRNDISSYNIDSPRIAAVLILLYPIKNKTHFALIKRPNYEGNHSGQIAFPGGKQEPEDTSITQTALREAREETNIKSKDVTIVGELSQIFIPPSNFLVTPILGFSNNQPEFIPEKREVESILEVPLFDLLNHKVLPETTISLKNGETLSTPYFSLKTKVVWGATAMILNELKYLMLRKY